MKTSTKGLKPCAFHFRSFAATTGRQSQASFKKKEIRGGGGEMESNLGGICSACSPFTLILCSPFGCGRMSTHMTASPTASTPDAVRRTDVLLLTAGY